MKTIFLTSSLENSLKVDGIRVAKKCDNTNGFVDRLKQFIKKIKTLVFFASDPDGYERTDSFANIAKDAFNLDGFGIEELIVVDHRFKGDLKKTVLSADVIFFAGGHVPTQNKFFKEISLKEIVEKYDGIVIGQSAGSMNCADLVYAPPETPEDLLPSYKRSFSGLALTGIRIMPHMELLMQDDVDGNGKCSYEYCLEDSYNLPVYGIYDTGFVEIHKGIATAYGKTLLIKDGKCKKLCENQQHIEINEGYEIQKVLEDE